MNSKSIQYPISHDRPLHARRLDARVVNVRLLSSLIPRPSAIPPYPARSPSRVPVAPVEPGPFGMRLPTRISEGVVREEPAGSGLCTLAERPWSPRRRPSSWSPYHAYSLEQGSCEGAHPEAPVCAEAHVDGTVKT